VPDQAKSNDENSYYFEDGKGYLCLNLKLNTGDITPHDSASTMLVHFEDHHIDL
jgi:hypothetical protein